MSFTNPQMFHQTHSIIRHRLNRIGFAGLIALPHAPVIESDYTVMLFEGVYLEKPVAALPAEPHYQYQGLALTLGSIEDIDSVNSGFRHLTTHIKLIGDSMQLDKDRKLHDFALASFLRS